MQYLYMKDELMLQNNFYTQLLYRPYGFCTVGSAYLYSVPSEPLRRAVTYARHAVELRMGDYKGRKLARIMSGPPGRLAQHLEARPILDTVSLTVATMLRPGQSMTRDSIRVAFLTFRFSYQKFCIHLFSPPCVLRAPPMSSSSIWSPE
jgi:hypothetical protein